ncbi:MAG: GNAT family N-acetyltransferase [Microlunatus sp.]|nr:GNAT family N-acetyltransferase [Microlunatus sp.]MDN5770812.1 GNAT family N-acetyltransferase [Microlunatus sp.]
MTGKPSPTSTGRDTGAEPTPPFAVSELSIDDGMDLAMWTTPGPWSVSDQLEPPERDEGYWAVRDANQRLVGYCCFGEAARVPGLRGDPRLLDVALGLRPDLVGHGWSNELARTVVERARSVAAGRRLQSVVAEWNTAGRHAAEAAGFKVAGAQEVSGGAAVSSYLVYTRAA